jgi:hypothetical protein
VKEDLPSDGPYALALILRLHRQPRLLVAESSLQTTNQLTGDSTREPVEPALVW